MRNMLNIYVIQIYIISSTEHRSGNIVICAAIYNITLVNVNRMARMGRFSAFLGRMTCIRL